MAGVAEMRSKRGRVCKFCQLEVRLASRRRVQQYNLGLIHKLRVPCLQWFIIWILSF